MDYVLSEIKLYYYYYCNVLNANIDAKKKAQYQTSLTQNYYNRIITYVLIMHNEYPEAVVIDPD